MNENEVINTSSLNERTNKNVIRLMIVGLCAVINLGAGLLTHYLQLPIFLDTLGTLLATILGGLFTGIATGIVSSLVGWWIVNPVLPYYTGTHIFIALCTAWLANRGFFRSVSRTVLSGIILGIAAAVASAPIIILFKGATETCTDPTTNFLVSHGVCFPVAVFLANSVPEPLDKVSLCILAFLIIKNLPSILRRRIKNLGYLSKNL